MYTYTDNANSSWIGGLGGISLAITWFSLGSHLDKLISLDLIWTHLDSLALS